MKKVATITTAIAMFMAPAMALAGEKAAIQAFYSFLSNPGSAAHAQAFRANVTNDWRSIGDYSGQAKSADQLIGQLGQFDKLIPDLEWEIIETIESENRIVVRGRATGTPSGPFFGVDGQGKSFTIMSIDIHTLENGKIAESYHVEDWAGALQQLRAN